MASAFFWDLITEILQRLPVKSLLRFKCVCKPWCYYIDSQDFIKSHLSHSTETNTHNNLIITSHDIYMTNLDSSTLNSVELNHPLKNSFTKTQVVGSCNGLLALINTSDTFDHVIESPNNNDHSLVLYNPSTREYHAVPDEDLPGIDIFLIQHYGFGYDPINDDYKLMKLVDFKANVQRGISKAEVKVYSLNTNSWKKVSNNLPNYICFIDPPGYYHNPLHAYGLYACGALHFRAPEMLPVNGTYHVVAFNLGVEEFSLIPLPNVEKVKNLIMGVFHGSLSVCDVSLESVDIYIMNEYGVKESWTKLLSVTQLQLQGIDLYVRPLVYSKGRDKVLLEIDNYFFVWYDLEKKIDELVLINNLPSIIFDGEICVESLVPVNATARVL